MESLRPFASFQLPFQKRLSRLYQDTKKSSEFVKEPIQNEEDPEMKNLHRKLRIQKDRLISWGMEWSDPNQSAEIDESLSKAGLSEVVGSIMGTIKDILAEAEPLWQSSKRVVEGPRPSPDKKAPLVRWDRGRFEDLIKDLTMSIDTLYDLSRTRASGITIQQPSKSSFKNANSADDFRPFESTRMQTPQHISPQTLTHVRPKHDSPGRSSPREVVLMSKTAYSELNQAGTTREPWAPLLLEYADYDSIYSMTGIMPPMARFEKLSAGLQQDPQRAPGTWTGLPRLLGYFEEMDKSRIGLIYRFPSSFNAVSFEGLSKDPISNLLSLDDLLSRENSEPALEVKFKLTYNLINTIFDLHARGITHGSLVSKNICFCDGQATLNDNGQETRRETDVRRPLLTSFELFPADVEGSMIRSEGLRSSSATSLPPTHLADERVSELCSLARVLVSIGLWTEWEGVAQELSPDQFPEAISNNLSIKCGSLFTKAVQACWSAAEEARTDQSSIDALLSRIQMKVSGFLEACCILDGVSGLEDRLNTEVRPAEQIVEPAPELDSHMSPRTMRDVKSPPPFTADNRGTLGLPELIPRTEPEQLPRVEVDDHEVSTKPPHKNENKIRLYPHVPLAPEAVDRWNKVLMPQVNHALRHFYRKNPESVEISLESVGPSPQKTEPTVVVVCSSVGKVRAILKKRMADVFDGPSALPLKVTRGHVVRSRRNATAVVRSMADHNDEIEAVNPEYQERPVNGASIGAWIGDRHLPPVSFGGLVMVDDKAYGMTVHHMLDDPDKEFGYGETKRSSALPGKRWSPESAEGENSLDDEFSYDLSDTESEPYSETDITSDWGDEDEEVSDYEEPGDIPGIEPGCGYGYVVTQPALDDVEDGFYPDSTTQDDDHLETYTLGDIYASSGIRRKEANGLVHEVDWALFEFSEDRQPDDNTIPRAQGHVSHRPPRQGDAGPVLRPTAVAPSSSLPGLEVQCIARTSGLQTGQILPTITSVKIYGRSSPSHTYQVASMPADKSSQEAVVPLGIPGDSGAWLVDRRHGQLCGHVLAWSQRKQVAYICPMDVLLLDVAQALEATEVKLPGGEPIISHESSVGKTIVNIKAANTVSQLADDMAALSHDGEIEDGDDDEDDGEDASGATEDERNDTMKASMHSLQDLSRSLRDHSSSPIRMQKTEDSKLVSRFDELRVQVGNSARIGVSG